MNKEYIKVEITYNTGVKIQCEMSQYTFDHYTKERHTLYNPKYPSVDANCKDEEDYISLFGAIRLRKIGGKENEN